MSTTATNPPAADTAATNHPAAVTTPPAADIIPYENIPEVVALRKK